MTIIQFIPLAAIIGAVIYILVFASKSGKDAPRGGWIFPAIGSALFLVFSLVTVASDGLPQFWYNHTQDLTGNQVWIDLLLAVSICMTLLVPEAKRLGMSVWPWVIAVLLTASIAILAMLARVMYLREKEVREA